MGVTLELDKEIIEAFQEEAKVLIGEMHDIVERLEDHKEGFPKELLEEFANRTDRLMGTAKTFEGMAPDHVIFKQIGKFGELCKVTGYKASTLNHAGLIPIFAAFWADTLDILEDLCENVGDQEKADAVSKGYLPTLQKRLTWLVEQIVKISKAGGGGEEAKINVDGLLRKMGFDV